MSDLRGMHRAADSATSVKAAASILPARDTIRTVVEAFARNNAAAGFIDEDLERRFAKLTPSSVRTRRAELAADGIIADSGRTRFNSKGREMIVWVHRDYAGTSPTPTVKKQAAPTTKRTAKKQRMADLEVEVVALRETVKRLEAELEKARAF